jgi:hypothetical protein
MEDYYIPLCELNVDQLVQFKQNFRFSFLLKNHCSIPIPPDVSYFTQ